MFLAINTASLDNDTPAALKRAQTLGFSHVEINLQPAEFGYGYRRRSNARFYRALRTQLDELNLSVWSVTPPFLTQSQMFSTRARKDVLLGSAIAAGLLGARVFVVRPEDVFISETHVADYIDQKLAPPTIGGYDEAWVQAANRRVLMALRNTDDWIGLPLINQVERMDKITYDLALGWGLDMHQAARRGQPDTWLAAVADRGAVAYAYDLEAGQLCAPRAEEWRAWLVGLGRTQIKTTIIQANPDQSDAEIKQSRDFFMSALNSE